MIRHGGVQMWGETVQRRASRCSVAKRGDQTPPDAMSKDARTLRIGSCGEQRRGCDASEHLEVLRARAVHVRAVPVARVAARLRLTRPNQACALMKMRSLLGSVLEKGQYATRRPYVLYYVLS